MIINLGFLNLIMHTNFFIFHLILSDLNVVI